MKTLNEVGIWVRVNNDEVELIAKHELKDAAKEWLEKFRNPKCSYEGEIIDEDILPFDLGYDGWDIKSWIEYFFNIEEE